MNLVRDLPLWDAVGNLQMIVEVPRGSEVKLKYDEATHTFAWSRPLCAGMRFPGDYGFLPQTLAEDGDAVDALLFSELASYPGVVVCGRAIAALRVEQHKDGQASRRNDRVLIAAANDHRVAHVRDVTDIAQRVLDELEQFFAASLALTGKRVTFHGWADCVEASALIEAAAARYAASL